MGGKLTPDDADDFAVSGLTFLQARDAPSTYTVPTPLGPGALSWGRREGCSFVNGHPRSWPSRYTCSKNQDYGCTPDNRMAAVCVIKSDYTREATCAGQYLPQNANTSALACGLANSPCTGQGCNIPQPLRFFTSGSAARAAAGVSDSSLTVSELTTGGFSAAMDYVPLQVGYWACNTNNPVGNVSAGVDGVDSGFSNFQNLFGSRDDISVFGGQARCPQCRCMKSSLMELTRTITPTFNVYGLCYRESPARLRCVHHAVLQRVTWHMLPPPAPSPQAPTATGTTTCRLR